MRGVWCAVVTAVVMVAGQSAYAQRAAENAVNSAEDAFGTSIGSETVGLYSASSARGFNPQLAGNIRLDGLYFDQQAQAQGRIYAGAPSLRCDGKNAFLGQPGRCPCATSLFSGFTANRRDQLPVAKATSVRDTVASFMESAFK